MIKKKPLAYAGKCIDYNKCTYLMTPEVSQGGCKGCDILNNLGCTTTLTDLCRQGYIFKKVKQ